MEFSPGAKKAQQNKPELCGYIIWFQNTRKHSKVESHVHISGNER